MRTLSGWLLLLLLVPYGHAHRLLHAENATHQRWTVECVSQPLLLCDDDGTCTEDALRQEQLQVFGAIQAMFPAVELIQSLHQIVNHLYLILPQGTNAHVLTSIDKVKKVYAAQAYQPQQLTSTIDYLGVEPARTSYCVTGRGVRVGILDTGVDYTHREVGGTGFLIDYQRAYGTNPSSRENKRRDVFFPTTRVVEGYDFLGDALSAGGSMADVDPDDDPIDGQGVGHGTAVAHAILKMAPDAEIVAVKICNTAANGEDSICPDFAVAQGLEYIFDIFRDRSNVSVDIINLSIGKAYGSAFFDASTQALSNAASRGVLAVLAQGNFGSSPYIASPLAGSPNVMAIGATESAESGSPGVASSYSSRGPGVNHMIKPDISAPGGPFEVADSSTGFEYTETRGTSYSCPLVAGAAALIKEKCPQCSPFGLRAILMNNARRTTLARRRQTALAPISRVGSGELDIAKALRADFWAYNVDDTQPSLGLGLINVDQDMTVSRTIRVQNLTPDGVRILSASVEFRDPDDEASGAVHMRFRPDRLNFSTCGEVQFLTIDFDITARNVPLNNMVTGGESGNDDANLDANEFDGWIVLSSGAKSISLPFHMILRRAAHVTMESTVLPELSGESTDVEVRMVNRGIGPAQVDAYELLYLGEDEPEPGQGSDSRPLDIRYVGYRVVPTPLSTCSSTRMIEFAISTWEDFRTPHHKLFEVLLSTDSNNIANKQLFSIGSLARTDNVECRIWDADASAWSCAGFAPDHVPDSANIVLRACSKDLGLTREGIYRMAVHTESFPGVQSDASTSITFAFPQPTLSADNYDLEPGAALQILRVQGDGRYADGDRSLGLLFLTNAYRSPQSTGAATRSTEALVLTRPDVNVPAEVTSDRNWEFQPINDLSGPDCSWSTFVCSSRRRPAGRRALRQTRNTTGTVRRTQGYDNIPDVAGVFDLGTCFELEVPRLPSTTVEAVPTEVPTASPTTLTRSPVELDVSTLAPTPTSNSISESPPSAAAWQAGFGWGIVVGFVAIFWSSL